MSVLICVPCYGGLVSDKTTNSLFNLAKKLVRNNIDHGLLTLANESLISKGRSKIANFFLNNTNYEYLFFLDADVGFNDDDFIKLLSHKKEIVSGAYPMKTIPLKWNFTLETPEKREGNLIAIQKIGIGFTLIHRSVFEKIIKKFGDELKYFPAHENINYKMTEKDFNNSYHFFHEYKLDNVYLPEDLSFFQRVKDCGVQPWLDVSINLSHVGSHVFKED